MAQLNSKKIRGKYVKHRKKSFVGSNPRRRIILYYKRMFTHAENVRVLGVSWTKPWLFLITKVKMHQNVLSLQ